jgi:hypothetical protein
MIKLNFPGFEFSIVEKKGRLSIFDPARKKFVALTPEEWVRQHVIQYLLNDRKIPVSLIRVESEIKLYKTVKRFDIAVADRNGNSLLIVECKAPSVPLSQDVLDQAVRYNMKLKVSWLMLTNGLHHFYCHVDPEAGSMKMISELPVYPFLNIQNSGD